MVNTAKQVSISSKYNGKSIGGKKMLTALLAVGIMTFSGTAGAAPAVPSPGEELPTPPEQGETKLENTLPEEQPTQAGARFTLTKVTMEHEGMKLRDEQLMAVTQPYLNREIDAGELDNMVAELTRLARKQYPAAWAYIPEQTAVDGKLTIRFEAGRFSTVKVDSEGVLHERVARMPLAGLRRGEIIESGKLETALRNLRDLPGIAAEAVLSPGSEQGTSDLTVKVTPRETQTYVLYAENYGSHAAGRYRYGFQADWRNPSATGNRLTIGALVSNGHQHGGSIAYEMPVGHSTTTVGIGYSHSDYELGSIWSQLGVEGKSDTVSLYGKTPLVNRYTGKTSLTYAFNYRKLKDELNGMDIGDRHSQSFSLGLEGFGRSSKNIVQYEVAFHTGTLTTDSATADALATAGGYNGGFTKGTLDVTAVQQLGSPAFDVLLKLSGQKAGSNLDSSERIYLGGARGVRAYPQGEASGDEGILGTLEVRYHLPVKGLTASIYYDAGHVRKVKSIAGSNTLQGWGLGLTYSRPRDWFARLDYARRIGYDEGLSTDANSRGRLWFMLGKVL